MENRTRTGEDTIIRDAREAAKPDGSVTRTTWLTR